MVSITKCLEKLMSVLEIGLLCALLELQALKKEQFVCYSKIWEGWEVNCWWEVKHFVSAT